MVNKPWSPVQQLIWEYVINFVSYLGSAAAAQPTPGYRQG
uniref:Uncharacterized protein n=1 Tax=Pseudomonas putida TaxID=303 RepID=A0A6B7PWB4_PSEPU|nr:hypothetical protein [Pseudomonas putida]